MPKGIFYRDPSKTYGFVKPLREYIVWIGDNAYWVGTRRILAHWALKRAQRPCKGEPAPSDGKECFLTIDGERQ